LTVIVNEIHAVGRDVLCFVQLARLVRVERIVAGRSQGRIYLR